MPFHYVFHAVSYSSTFPIRYVISETGAARARYVLSSIFGTSACSEITWRLGCLSLFDLLPSDSFHSLSSCLLATHLFQDSIVNCLDGISVDPLCLITRLNGTGHRPDRFLRLGGGIAGATRRAIVSMYDLLRVCLQLSVRILASLILFCFFIINGDDSLF